MIKKYQVFVSSTYEDLKEERKKVQEVLLMGECIPIGMEAFVADNDEQFNIIKKKIDLCDYYILIIGNRYGSINPETQLSYTEMEYNYAIEKSLPVLVFASENTENKHGESDEKQEKLRVFREKALKSRMASIWKDINDLSLKVVSAISNAKETIARPGWVRGGKYNPEELLEQLNTQREENASLKIVQKDLQQKIEDLTLNDEEEKFWDKLITIPYIVKKEIVEEKGKRKKKKISYVNETKYFCKAWYEIYQYVIPFFYHEHNSSLLKEMVKSLIGDSNVTLDDSEVLKIKHQMFALKYISLRRDTYAYEKPEKMQITQKGLTALNKILLSK